MSDDRVVAGAALRLHERYGVGFTRRLRAALERLDYVETGEGEAGGDYSLSLTDPAAWLDPEEYPPEDADEWSEPTGWELAAEGQARYQQRQVTRGPRKGQTGWYDTAGKKFMPKDWKPKAEGGARKPAAPARPKAEAAAKPKAAPAEKPAKPKKLTVDEAHERIKAGGADVGALTQTLLGLTVPEVKELRARLGLTKGSGAKQKLADELVAKVVAGGEAKPAEKKAPARPKPPIPDAPAPAAVPPTGHPEIDGPLAAARTPAEKAQALYDASKHFADLVISDERSGDGGAAEAVKAALAGASDREMNDALTALVGAKGPKLSREKAQAAILDLVGKRVSSAVRATHGPSAGGGGLAGARQRRRDEAAARVAAARAKAPAKQKAPAPEPAAGVPANPTATDAEVAAARRGLKGMDRAYSDRVRMVAGLLAGGRGDELAPQLLAELAGALYVGDDGTPGNAGSADNYRVAHEVFRRAWGGAPPAAKKEAAKSIGARVGLGVLAPSVGAIVGAEAPKAAPKKAPAPQAPPAKPAAKQVPPAPAAKRAAPVEVPGHVDSAMASVLSSEGVQPGDMAPADVGKLRDAAARLGVAPEDFERELFRRVDAGQAYFNRHNNPGLLSPEQRARLVRNPDKPDEYFTDVTFYPR